MGNCIYCGNPAGLFRSKHAECERIVQSGRQRIKETVSSTIRDSGNFDDLEKAIGEIERSCLIQSSERNDLLVQGWETTVEQFLEDGVLDRAEETRLVQFKERFALPQSDLDRNGAFSKIAKAAILRDLLSGILPQRVSINGQLPVNLQKGEQVVWAFAGSKYLEDKTRHHFVGGSQGVSVRLMKGVYYRVGAFKGHAVEETERVHVDSGWVIVTNKNIYFTGPRKSLRLPYAKIVSFEPFSDGIGVMRDAATAKPQIFVTGDGWFTYNLVTNLSQL